LSGLWRGVCLCVAGGSGVREKKPIELGDEKKSSSSIRERDPHPLRQGERFGLEAGV